MKNTWLWSGILIIVVTLSISSVFGLYNAENKCKGYDFSNIESGNSESNSNGINIALKNQCDQIDSNLLLSHIILAFGVGISIVGFIFHS